MTTVLLAKAHTGSNANLPVFTVDDQGNATVVGALYLGEQLSAPVTQAGMTALWIDSSGTFNLVGPNGSNAGFKVLGTFTISGGTTQTGTLALQPPTGASVALSINVAGSQGFDNVRILGSGQIQIGPGTSARDVFIGRAGASTGYVEPNLLVGATAVLGDNGVGEIQLANATTVPTTNPTGGALLYSSNGGVFSRDPSGVVSPLATGAEPGAAATGVIAETVRRLNVTNAAAGASGTLYLASVFLSAGQTISKIGFISNTAATTPSHWWTALLDNTFKQQAHASDQTTTAINATTWNTLTMVTPFTATYTGLYYLAVMIAATGMPNLACTQNAPIAAITNGTGAPTPVAGGTSTTGLTTPGTDGTTTYATPTTIANYFYLYCE